MEGVVMYAELADVTSIIALLFLVILVVSGFCAYLLHCRIHDFVASDPPIGPRTRPKRTGGVVRRFPALVIN